jgi:hypothetical protein
MVRDFDTSRAGTLSHFRDKALQSLFVFCVQSNRHPQVYRRRSGGETGGHGPIGLHCQGGNETVF